MKPLPHSPLAKGTHALRAVARHVSSPAKGMRFLQPVALCALLSACAAPPEHVRPELTVPAAYKALPPEPGQAARPAELNGDPWWTVFADPTLDALIARVDADNQDLRRIEALARQSRAAIDAARANLYPFVGGGAAATRSRQAGSTLDTYSLSASADWEVDLWGRIRSGVAAAEASAGASDADLAAARLALQAQAAQAYHQLRIADAQRRLLAETVTSYRRSLELTRNRMAVGVATRGDVAQAETQLKNAEAQQLEVGIARAQLEHALALLTGRAPTALALAEAPMPADVPVVPAGLPSRLLERRPDIAAAERRVAAANAQLGIARAAYFPALTLTADGGFRANRLSELLSLPSRIWSFGPVLAATLFDGGARDAVSAQVAAAHDATVAAYRQTVLAAFGEVEDNLVALTGLADQERVQREALAAARTSLDIAELQYKAGTVSYLNVIVAQTAVLQSERAALDLRGRRLAASVGLIKAIGGAW
jgi:NodT family efflux transporter outer membrane factor (OMF) lipoprotein